MRVIVFTGGRNYTDQATFDRIATFIDAAQHEYRWTPYVGCAAGLDALVRARWKNHFEFIAEWKRLGRAAGPERNNRMLEGALEVTGDRRRILVVAFPGSAGTANCVRRARELGLTVLRVEP